MALINCRDLILGYEDGIVAENINFEVNAGDYLCIVGENGAGKSTLMKTLLHLIKPAGGTLEFGDGLKEYEIGYLPQQTPVQRDFPASVYEIVLSGNLSRIGKRFFFGKKEKERTAAAMEKLGITDLKKKCYRNLSGGQQQRVLLARALCAADKLILLDEPVSGLDPAQIIQMRELIQKLSKTTAILMSTHLLQEVYSLCSNICIISEGKIAAAGTEEQIAKTADTKNLEEAFVKLTAGNGD